MAQPPTYRSQAYIPIHKDDKSFEERQRHIWDEMQTDMDKSFLTGEGRSRQVGPPAGFMNRAGIWDDMHSRMDEKRKTWEEEVEKMRTNFFSLNPYEPEIKPTNNNGQTSVVPTQSYVDKGEGHRAFRVSFDVSEFNADEISVHAQNNKLIVHAKHEEKGQGKSVSREFNREVDIPKHVDAERLQSTLSKDGILQVEAPVLAPTYDKINDNQSANLLQNPGPAIQRQSAGLMSSSPLLNPKFIQPTQRTYSVIDNGTSNFRTPSPGFKTGPVITEQDGTKQMKITLEIGQDFKPEDINVKTVDKALHVSARHEEKREGRTSVKEFSKELDLPENVDPNTVTASVSDDGKLIIEAPISSYTQGSYQGSHGSFKQPEISVAFN